MSRSLLMRSMVVIGGNWDTFVRVLMLDAVKGLLLLEDMDHDGISLTILEGKVVT